MSQISNNEVALTCLVLMLKAPTRSKRRLNAQIGASATEIAERLIDCALEDVRHWPGPKCIAPSAPEDREWLSRRRLAAAIVIDQCAGNLGERIAHVNHRLLSLGHERQIFIGIDCPAIDSDYLGEAGGLLGRYDVVLGPAMDGGVVLMGVNGEWPRLESLAWSTSALQDQLVDACRAQKKSIALMHALHDIDEAGDLPASRIEIGADPRPARVMLAATLQRAITDLAK